MSADRLLDRLMFAVLDVLGDDDPVVTLALGPNKLIIVWGEDAPVVE